MDFEDFLKSTLDDQPGNNLKPLLQSLWWDKKGDWGKAHDIAQDVHAGEGSWVHAYLHRKEGDVWNADYWYAKAGKSRPDVTLDAEWETIVRALLTDK